MSALPAMFRKLTPLERAARELSDAQSELLSAHTAAEYAQSIVQYNESRIERLKNYMRSENETRTIDLGFVDLDGVVGRADAEERT